MANRLEEVGMQEMTVREIKTRHVFSRPESATHHTLLTSLLRLRAIQNRITVL